MAAEAFYRMISLVSLVCLSIRFMTQKQYNNITSLFVWLKRRTFVSRLSRQFFHRPMCMVQLWLHEWYAHIGCFPVLVLLLMYVSQGKPRTGDRAQPNVWVGRQCWKTGCDDTLFFLPVPCSSIGPFRNNVEYCLLVMYGIGWNRLCRIHCMFFSW